jgi:phage replication-related protein YjqB (UPF0714/DUF867 family)
MADKYSSFSRLELGERRGLDYRVRTRKTDSVTTIIAPHGGAIEPGTTEIADSIAGEDFSFYSFEGIRPRQNDRLHITSSRFDEPRCLDLLKLSNRAISIHGENSSRKVVFLGGRDRSAMQRINASLRKAGFCVETHKNPQLQGRLPSNVCNRTVSGDGVQLELSRGLRKSFFETLSRKGRKKRSKSFFDFTEAVREAIL